MPATKSNPAARLFITLIVVGAAIGFVLFLFTSKNANRAAQAPPPAAATESPQAGAPDATLPPAPASAASDTPPAVADEVPPAGAPPTDAAATPTAPPITTGALAARIYPSGPAPAGLGSLDPSQFRSRVEFTLAGAGVRSITLANYFETIQDTARARHEPGAQVNHYQLQSQATAGGVALVSLAASSIEINGQAIGLFSAQGRPVWRETAPGQFVAEIVDSTTDATAIRITREYTLAPGSYTLAVRQRIENLTAAPVSIRWFQFGPVDLAEDPNANNTPTRRIRFGYLLDQRTDPSQSIIRADSRLTDHNKVLKDIQNSGGAASLLWPNAAKFKDAGRLTWVAQTSRYFAFAVHPPISQDEALAALQNPSQAPITRTLDLADQVYAQALGSGVDANLALELVSAAQIVNPGATLALDFGAYAGPLSRQVLASKTMNPVGRILNLHDMVVFQLGMCGFCAFQPIARLLLATLRFFHDYIVFDWGFAIILLVICIRGILHPVFKRSQISMMRFSRQMQRLAPKQKALQQKFKDDPKKLREEQMRLMREENVNYAGMLGCVPMFLQTPIWIALYAMLFFAFELRHQPAFFGVFQKLTGSQWMFLADLSRPDNFIPLPWTFNIPLLGRTSAINILPLILGVVFYLHQKIITPQTTTQLSPEQEQAQKIAKWMMVVMFPLFMYNQSAGLCLYFVTNSCVAIFEGHHIRAHADRLNLDEPAKPRAPRPPLGRKSVANTASNPFKKQRDAKRFKDRE